MATATIRTIFYLIGRRAQEVARFYQASQQSQFLTFPFTF
jgi:hypothetical protein